MEEVKDLVFNAPTPDTPGFPRRMKAALNFQIAYAELKEEMDKAEKANDKSLEIETSKKMLKFFDDLIDFLKDYVEANSPAEAKELLENCTENQLMSLRASLQGGGEKELPPQNTESSSG